MKVEIAENWGEAAIICYVGLDEVKVTHKETKLGSEGQYLDEIDVMVALLNAASAAVGSVPRTEWPPEGTVESKADRLEREEKNRKAIEDWTKERERIEAEEDEELRSASYAPLVTNQGPQPDPGYPRPAGPPIEPASTPAPELEPASGPVPPLEPAPQPA